MKNIQNDVENVMESYGVLKFERVRGGRGGIVVDDALWRGVHSTEKVVVQGNKEETASLYLKLLFR